MKLSAKFLISSLFSGIHPEKRWWTAQGTQNLKASSSEFMQKLRLPICVRNYFMK